MDLKQSAPALLTWIHSGSTIWNVFTHNRERPSFKLRTRQDYFRLSRIEIY